MKYEKYKDSGVEWIGEIPEYWEVAKVKHHFSNYKNIVGEKENEFQRLALTMNGVVKRSKEDSKGLQPEKFEGYQILNKNELVFKLIDLKNISTSRVGLSPYTGIVSPAYIILRANNQILPEFAEKYFLTLWYRNIFNMIGADGVRSSLSASDLLDVLIMYPRKKIQKSIVEYIDNKTSQIDKAIEELELQLEKLETYRRELISKVVTKGLNPNVKMKDSGVDWIGEVPEHWSITKIKWMFEIVKRIYGIEGRPVLSITQNGIKIKNTDENEGQMAESYEKYQIVNINDFAMNSMDLLTGWVDCSKYEGVTSPDYRVFRFRNDKIQNHRYYNYLFQLCYTSRVFYRLGQGVSNLGRWRLQAEQFLNMYLPQPSIDEQQQITTYLDKKSDQINTLKTDITKQIENLKTYRKIIIRDAVTGKIKVAKED
ncbi:type I restriction enzyme S subunit [Streptococcus gallinaceus]|uniref:restriction endonuclease subunit S n=1 Tax=Streptococcus gallinaceus TaxID=165758 RepID=UPI0020A0D22D|nr:restriction endonuclease subunit S [Streptococcus gallinaceus]MCP1638573.1 type I restriction enzyme S subunit [Streptococcus gallinaceus]MCP1769340.1 type I restriction enzyme S subunit [Streptococcus gallinaceus]